MKKFLILFTSVFCSFILINKVKASTETIYFDFPFNEESFSVDIDTETYPYYIGTMYTNYDSSNNTGTFRISFYYSDEPFYYTSAQSNYCQIPGYMSTYCYGFIHKTNGSNAKVIIANYSISLNTEISRTEYNYTSNAGSIVRYNYRDFVDNVGSFRWLDNNYPYFDGSVGWILSDDLKDSNGNVVLSKDYINLTSVEPDYSYEVMPGSDKGQRVLFEFKNFSENSYISVVDMSTGSIFIEEDLYMSTTFDIDNITFDSILYYEIYNDDELFDSGTINIYSNFLATGQPVININLNRSELTATLGYYEIKNDYNLYYSINDDNFINIEDNPENLEIVHLDNDRLVHFPNTGVRENNNYVLRGRITDSNGRILYDIGYNVVFFPDKPYFSFESSYNPNSGANEVKITLHNFQNNDIVYYSYDNINFTQFDSININTLVVYADTDIYTKVVRGNNTYYGFYHVNLNGYNNSSNAIYDNTNGYDDNLFTGFNNLFTGIDMSFLDNISTFFNALKGSYVFRFVMLCITGALILFIMRMIRR